MRELHKVFFVIALVVIAVVLLVELGSSLLGHGAAPSAAHFASTAAHELGPAGADIQLDAVAAKPPRPGLGIPYLALLDGLVLLTMALMGLSLLLPERVHGRIQGVITLVVSLVVAVASVVALFAALALLLTMLGLLVSVPFGTLAYLAIWGFFDRGGAALTLGLVLVLKLAFAVLLVLAHPRFLQNKGLMLLLATSLVANVVISFLHGLVPGILVSITDGIAAIVVAVLALVWSLVLLVGAIVAIVKAITSAV